MTVAAFRPSPPAGPVATGERDRSAPAPRSALKAVSLPTEHGGWGLIVEPGLLGLLVAPSVAGAALAVAGVLAFLLRTPLKLVGIDRRRGRRLPRTRLAGRVAAVEGVLVLLLAALALTSAGPAWLVPVAGAAPFVAVELWFGVRSRGRRLVPELCGAIGTGSLAAAVAVAGGAPTRVAVVLWLLLAARSLAAIPYVRTQVQRLHRRGGATPRPFGSDMAQAAGVVVAAVAVVVEPAAAPGAAAVAAAAVLRLVAVRRPPVPAVRLGALESAFGVAVVVATAVGLHVGGAL